MFAFFVSFRLSLGGGMGAMSIIIMNNGGGYHKYVFVKQKTIYRGKIFLHRSDIDRTAHVFLIRRIFAKYSLFPLAQMTCFPTTKSFLFLIWWP